MQGKEKGRLPVFVGIGLCGVSAMSVLLAMSFIVLR
jgi:hypothetical protein